MNRRISILAGVLLIAFTVPAKASDHFWFSHISSTSPFSTPSNTGPGLPLTYGTAVGPATIRVGVNITSDTNALAGWEFSLNLISSFATFANGTAHGTGYDQVFNFGPDGTNSFHAARGSSSVTGSTGLIYSFDIVVASGPHSIFIYGDFGFQGIVKSNGLYWDGYVANNAYSIAGGPHYTSPANGDFVDGWGNLPVIYMAPEPASLGLVAIAVLLLKRGRAIRRL